jgi:DNA-directed RNA polymerase specialized sigma24 family protein
LLGIAQLPSTFFGHRYGLSEMAESLPSTHISQLLHAFGQDQGDRERAVLELMEGYARGLNAYVRCRFGFDPDSAEDAVRRFMSEKAPRIIERYLEFDGRRCFRAYLTTALHNAVIDEVRRHRTGRDIERAVARQDEIEQEISSIVSIEWFRDIISVVFRRVSAESIAKNRHRDWDVFVRRCLTPVLTQSKAPSYDCLAQEFHLQSPKQAANVIETMKRRFESALRRVVEEDLGTRDSTAVESELREVRRCMVHAGAIRFSDVFAALAEAKSQEGIDLSVAGPTQMTSILDLAVYGNEEFSDTELEVLYQHYLSSPLSELFEVAQIEMSAWQSKEVARSDDSLCTIEALLTHRDPPLELLRDLKLLSRRLLKSGTARIPTRIALVFRFVGIGRALIQYGETMSKLSNDELREGFRRVLEYPWLDDKTRALFTDAVSRL